MKTFLTILLVSSAVANTTATNCKLFDAKNATIDVKNGLSIEGLNVAMKAGTEFATLTTENVELFSISDSTYITVNLDKDSQTLTFYTTLEFENYQRYETNREIEIFIQNFKCSDGGAVTGFASPMFVFPLKFSNIYPPEFLVDDMVVESVTFNISMPFPKISLTKNYHSIYAIDMDLQNNNISFELDDIGKKYLEMTPTQLKNGLRTNYSIDLTPITVLNIETELAIHLNAWDSGNPSMNSSLEILFTSDVKATTPISPWFKEAFYLADMSDLTSKTIKKDTIQPISFSSSITLQEGYDEQLTIYLSGDSNDSFTAKLNTNLPVPSVEINLVGTPNEELLQLPFVTFELMAVRDGALKPGRTAIFIKLPGSLCAEPTTTESPTTVTTECDCPTEETTTIEPCPTTFTPELTTPCPDCICTTETTESSVAGQTTTTSGETTPQGNSTPVSTSTTTSGRTSPSSELTTQCPTFPECDCSADTTESSLSGQTTSGETTPEGSSTSEIISSSVPDQKTSSSGLTTEYPPIPECSSTTETSLVPDKTSSSTGETSKPTKNTSTSVTDPITPSTDEPSYCTPCPSPSEPSSDTSSTGQTDEPSHCTPCPSSSDHCPTTSCDTPQDCSSCPTFPSEPSSDTSPSDHCPTTSCDTPQDCSSCPTLPSEPSSDSSSTGQTGSTTSTPVTVKFQRTLYVFPSVSQDNEDIRIGRVEADVTGTSELPKYSLEDNKDNFVINSSNGDINAKQSIDPGTWVISAVATCEGVVDKTQVQVTVSNFVNCLNNETKLVNTLLTMEFPEESEQTIYDIPEPDVLNCNWKKVSEEPLSGTDGLYVVYENGTILTSGIDREDNIFKNMSVAEVLLQVNISCPNDETHSEATYDGTSDRSKPWYPLRNLRNSHRDMYFLTVITDINDNNPEFEGTNPLIVGYPDAKVVKQLLPQNVATVKATDKDIGINALIRYEIEKSDVSSWFVIHPHTGVIYPNENHFQFKDAEFNVIAKDLDGGQGCLQSERLVVKMKILAFEHLSVLSIEGKLVEDANETVLAIGNSLNYSVKVLLSAVVPSTEATIRSSSSSMSRVLRADQDTQSSLLYMVIYAIDKTTQEPVPAKTFNNQLASSNPSWKVSQLSSSTSQGSTGSSENSGGLLGGVIALAVILILLLGGAGVAYYVLRIRRRKNTQIVDYDNFTAADSDSISRENHIIEEIPYLEKPAEVTARSIFNEYDEIMPTDSTNVNEEDSSRPTYQTNIALSFGKDLSLVKDEDGDRKQSFTLQGSESEETSDEPHDERQKKATDTIDEGRDEEMLDLSSKSIVKFNDNVELIEIERL